VRPKAEGEAGAPPGASPYFQRWEPPTKGAARVECASRAKPEASERREKQGGLNIMALCLSEPVGKSEQRATRTHKRVYATLSVPKGFPARASGVRRADKEREQRDRWSTPANFA